MAGHSEKKYKKQKDSFDFITQCVFSGFSIIGTLLFFIYCENYNTFFMKFFFFIGINFLFVKLLCSFYDSMFFNYIFDVAIVHLVAMIAVNFHNKGFAVYLSIPGYLVYLGCKAAYNHVKSIDQSPPEQEEATNEKSNSKTKKKKYIQQ